MDMRVVYWATGIIVALVIFLIALDLVRRRRLRKRSRGREPGVSSKPNFFKRTVASFRDLQRELERRNNRKSRHRDRDK
jgi:hypothetical protein